MDHQVLQDQLVQLDILDQSVQLVNLARTDLLAPLDMLEPQVNLDLMVHLVRTDILVDLDLKD